VGVVFDLAHLGDDPLIMGGDHLGSVRPVDFVAVVFGGVVGGGDHDGGGAVVVAAAEGDEGGRAELTC